MSAADDLVEPSWLQVPKWASATVSGQRSAAQNGHDSSLTKTIAGLPPMVSSGPGACTVCKGVAASPWFTRVSTAAGTAVTCLTTAEEAGDSLAIAAVAGAELDSEQRPDDSQDSGDRCDRHQELPARLGALLSGSLGGYPLAGPHRGLRASRPG